MVYDIGGNALNTIYSIDGDALDVACDIDGNEVFSAVEMDYTEYTVEHLRDINIANTQGFDIYDGTLFQFRAGSGVSNRVTIANINTGTILAANVSVTSDHGDSATFSRTRYNPTDRFPLLYVSADTSPYIYVNRVTDSTATLIQTLYLPYNVAGYHAVGTYDWSKHIMYTIGTVEDNYLDDDGGENPCIVCKWDLSMLTDNGNGTYTPRLLNTYQRPFIYVMQGEQFHDGYIWICSGYGNSNQYIYAMNPDTGEFEYTLTMPINTEIEGMAWQKRNGLDYAIVGFQGGKYYELTFGVLN